MFDLHAEDRDYAPMTMAEESAWQHRNFGTCSFDCARCQAGADEAEAAAEAEAEWAAMSPAEQAAWTAREAAAVAALAAEAAARQAAAADLPF